MTQIGVQFHNVLTVLDVWTSLPSTIGALNEQFVAAGGSAVLINDASIHLTLCEGHSVTITQMHTYDWVEVAKQLDHKFYYMDIEINVPGCHDEFGGIIGQMYQCK